MNLRETITVTLRAGVFVTFAVVIVAHREPHPHGDGQPGDICRVQTSNYHESGSMLSSGDVGQAQ